MHRSRFGKASWIFLGTAVAWALWMLALTASRGSDIVDLSSYNVCNILPISGTLALLGMICGIIGIFRSQLGQSNCTAAIMGNIMFLIALLLFACP